MESHPIILLHSNIASLLSEGNLPPSIDLRCRVEPHILDQAIHCSILELQLSADSAKI